MSHYSALGASMIAKADFFAFTAHEAIGQKRKYTGDPYINHPRAVAKLVQGVSGHSWSQVVVALLHDVVEDTHITREHIEDQFGPMIADHVWFLSNVGLEAGNRKARFEINLARIATAPNPVKTVKIADLIDNTATIAEYDPSFAPVFLREKQELLERALLGGDETLWGRAHDQCVNALASLGPKP